MYKYILPYHYKSIMSSIIKYIMLYKHKFFVFGD